MPHHPGDELAWIAYWRGDLGDQYLYAACRIAFLAGRQSVRDEAAAAPLEQPWQVEEILAREG